MTVWCSFFFKQGLALSQFFGIRSYQLIQSYQNPNVKVTLKFKVPQPLNIKETNKPKLINFELKRESRTQLTFLQPVRSKAEKAIFLKFLMLNQK